MPYARIDKMVWLRGGRAKAFPGSIVHIVLPDDEDSTGTVVKIRSLCGALVAVKVDFGEWRTPAGKWVVVKAKPHEGRQLCKACASCKNERAVAAKMMERR